MKNLKLVYRQFSKLTKTNSKGNFHKPTHIQNIEYRMVNSEPTTPVCILVHSWLGSKAEMENIAQMLTKSGSNVVLLDLLGHGTVAEDLVNYTLQDWINQLKEQVSYISNQGFLNIFLFGQCGGGNVILNFLSQNHRNFTSQYIKGLVLASVPSLYNEEVTRISKWYNTYYRMLLRPLYHIIPPYKIAKRMLHNKLSESEKVIAKGYNQRFPMLACGEGVELIRKSAQLNLQTISCPALIFHYSNDFFYSLKHAKNLFENINKGIRNKLVQFRAESVGVVGSHHLFNNLNLTAKIEYNILGFISENKF